MNKDELLSIFRQIERLTKLALSDAPLKKSDKVKIRNTVVQKGNNPSRTTLPEHIIALRDSGFFKEPKTSIETHKKLQPIYACNLDRVTMSLLRLQRRQLLRKTSKIVDKKKQLAYVW